MCSRKFWIKKQFARFRPDKAKLIVTDCGFDKYIVSEAIKEISTAELGSMLKSNGAPFIQSNEVEVAMALQKFTDCQQNACLTMVIFINNLNIRGRTKSLLIPT